MMTNRTGVWYYEVMLITSGVVHVGWASPSSQFIPEQGYGVGDNMVRKKKLQSKKGEANVSLEWICL